MDNAQSQHLATLHVHIEGGDYSDDELDRLTRQLRSELRDSTDAERVDLVGAGPAPSGTKGAEAIALGNLLVTLLPTAVPGVIGLLRAWFGRHDRGDMKVTVKVGDRSVELEYPVGEMTRDDLMNLISVVTRPSAPGGAQEPA
jgi:Effector Associated Constant Component 1